MSLEPSLDPMGHAIADYFRQSKASLLVVHSDVTDPDAIPVPYLFRDEAQLPALERLAIKRSRGHVLDVGAGAGPHALLLQAKGLAVTAIDQSQLSVEVMKQRGVHDASVGNIFSWNGQYDTILLLMNGLGIAGDLAGLRELLTKLSQLLKPNGQVLVDSCDIRPLYEEEDGSQRIELNRDHPGVVTYEMEYRGIRSKPFKWLYLPFDELRDAASAAGFEATQLHETPELRYLAQLTISL